MLETLHTQSKRLLYRLRRDFLTLNNVVIVVALLIALNWTWNSIEVMQQNYELQQSVDAKRRQVELERLRVDTLQLESKFYTTLEWQELAVRERLGKGKTLEGVIREIQTRELAITEFDEKLWLAVIDKVTVGRDGSLTFRFKNGSKVEA